MRAGDVVVGFASPGLRQNGYSLARKALLERAGRRLDEPAWHGAHHTLGDELLRPSVIYAPGDAEAPRARAGARVRAHHRRRDPRQPRACAPAALRRASSRAGTWDEPRIFAEIQAAGGVPDDEMEHVFNLGLGMLAVVAPEDRLDTLDVMRSAGHDAWLGRGDCRRAGAGNDQALRRSRRRGTEAANLHIRDRSPQITRSPTWRRTTLQNPSSC